MALKKIKLKKKEEKKDKITEVMEHEEKMNEIEKKEAKGSAAIAQIINDLMR